MNCRSKPFPPLNAPLLIRNPAKQVRPADSFPPRLFLLGIPWSPANPRINARQFIARKDEEKMVIVSEWNMREFLRGVYFPPPPRVAYRSRRARGGGGRRHGARWRKVSLRSAQLHLLRADTLVRAAFNVLTANGLASRGGIVRHLGYRERGRVRGRFVRGVR